MTAILVTGATGFIGRSLCERLAADDHQIVRAVRKKTAADGEVVVEDIETFKGWQDVLRGLDVVIHLAGRAHILNDRAKDPLEDFRRVNTRATIALAKQAASAGIKRFVFMSSIGVNGNETHEKPFSVHDIPHPPSPYAISKYEAELELRNIARSTGLEVVIIRPPLVYGPNAPGNFESMMRWLSKGVPLPLGAVTSNRRSFVALDNLIDLTVTCIDHPKAANQTFLVSDGEDLSTADLLLRLSFALGKQAHLLSVPPRMLSLFANLVGKKDMAVRLLGNLQVDIQHTCETLAWRPPVSVEKGFARVAMHNKP